MAHVNKTRRSWQPVYKPHERRAQPNKDFYNSAAWRKLSAQQKMRQPLCVACAEKGYTTPGTVADHITPINKGGQELDQSNLQTLCASCHNIKSAHESKY